MAELKWSSFASARRKHGFNAHKALVLLTDLTHNLLADFRYRGLANSPFTDWGSKRIVRDLLAIPGRLYFEGGQLATGQFKRKGVDQQAQSE